MDLHDTLTLITLGGLALSFVAGVVSQLWITTVDIQGKPFKRLTPRGWLSLAISAIGLFGSIASELIRVSISHDEEIQTESEAIQRKVLAEQEARWRHDVQGILRASRVDLAQNLARTIEGFRNSQDQFNATQSEVIGSRQALLVESLRRTNEILVASQPLMRLKFELHVESVSAGLRRRMAAGQQAIFDNAETAQGPSLEIPAEVVEFDEALSPLLRHIAKAGRPIGAFDPRLDDVEEQDEKAAVVLVALDEAPNAILAFGSTGRAGWMDKRTKIEPGAGFLADHTTYTGPRRGSSSPAVRVEPSGSGGPRSRYSIVWDLDPVTLSRAVDRNNPSIPSTAKLPKHLRVAVLYDIFSLPFSEGNFGDTSAVNLWSRREWTPVRLGSELSNVQLSIAVNGISELTYQYRLVQISRVRLLTDYDDEIATECTMLEFEAV